MTAAEELSRAAHEAELLAARLAAVREELNTLGQSFTRLERTVTRLQAATGQLRLELAGEQ